MGFLLTFIVIACLFYLFHRQDQIRTGRVKAHWSERMDVMGGIVIVCIIASAIMVAVNS